MKRLVIVLVSAFLLFTGQGFVLSLAPHSSAASDVAGDFTAATLLAEKGTHGGWLMKEPPGFPPVECNLLRDENRFRAVVVELPLLFPAEGFVFQQIRATYRLNRRLPDGKLVPVIANPVAGEITATSHLEGITSFEGDLGSTYVVTAHIGWLDNSGREQGSVDLLYTQYQTTIFGPRTRRSP